MDAEAFFRETLPRLFAGSPPGRDQGSIYVAVDGCGEWTISLGTRSYVEPGRRSSPALELYFAAPAFERFLDGTAPETGRGFFAVGDAKLLERLARVIAPASRGVVALRASE
jgi:hypothetical protein